MKTKTFSKFTVLFTAYLFFSNASLLSQSGWDIKFADSNASFSTGGIYFTSVNTGYAVGWKRISDNMYPRIVKTTDAGSSWSYLTTPLQDSAFLYFRYVFFTDANTGFVTSATALPPVTANGKILKTTDAGSTWSVYTPSVNKHMTCIWFVNSNTGYATGYQTILKTTNAGTTWELSFEYGSFYLFGIYFVNVNTGFVVGNSGYIYRTTDGGSVWYQERPQLYTSSLWGVWFTDVNTGFVVGGQSSNVGNKIFRTTNCGSSWDSVANHPPGNNFLYFVSFLNMNTGFITGWNQALKTTDGGLNWYALPLPVPQQNDFFAAGTFFTNASTGYIAGSANAPLSVGIVLKTTTGGEPLGIKPISNEIPDRFSLNQNYPNPFNPVTKINFELPQSGDVKLTLYDLLGREVAVLANEKLSPGTYEVDFDGTNYPSGVYFYTLTTGDFVDTKKMILVK